MFLGEMSSIGQDAGGMEKEWFSLICAEFLNEDTGLFRKAATDELSYVIEEGATKVDQYQEKYEFFGHMLAKGILDEIPLNLCLNRLFFKIFLNPDYEVTVDDVKLFDQQTHSSFNYILDNDIDEDDYIKMNFEHEYDDENYPLKEDGLEIEVDDDNKDEYIKLKANFMVKNFTTDQMNFIRDGFEELIPLKYLKSLTFGEFEYLCNGESKIDLDDWKNNSVYTNGYDHHHKVIEWFWDIVEGLDQEPRSVIFQYVTGMSRLPVGGFGSMNNRRGEKQAFNIKRVNYDEYKPYITAYTCFNRMMLPEFQTKRQLEESIDFLVDNKEVYGFWLL